MNILSSFVDASQIYGDTVKHFVELRKMDGKKFPITISIRNAINEQEP